MLIRLLLIAIVIVIAIIGYREWQYYYTDDQSYEATQAYIDERLAQSIFDDGQAMSYVQADEAAIVLGKPDSPLEVIAFFSYDCAPCQIFNQDIPQLLEQNPDLRLVLRPMPLENKESISSVRFVLAAGRAGKMREAHDALMIKGEDTVPFDIAETAMALSLSAEDIEKDMMNLDVSKSMIDTLDATRILEVNSIPSFLINGVLYQYDGPEPLQAKIDEAKAAL